MLDELVKQLIAGMPGATVLEQLKGHYMAGHSQEQMVYAVRRKVMERNYRHPQFDDSRLRAFAAEPSVTDFLRAPLKKQVTIQRQHGSAPTWSEGAERALANLQLLPDNLADFCLTKAEILANKKASRDKIVAKNDAPFVVEDAQRVMEVVLRMLHDAKPSDTYQTLVPALQLASGRRQTEITNGKSSFEPIEGRPMYARFTGQLKTKQEEDAPYIIPLLVPYDVFIRAFQALRARQAAGPPIPDTNEGCHQRYGKNIQRGLDQMTANGTWPLPRCNEHKMRAIYAALVYELFDCPHTFNRTCQIVLGHSDITDSLSYSDALIRGCDGLRDVHGPLCLS